MRKKTIILEMTEQMCICEREQTVFKMNFFSVALMPR